MIDFQPWDELLKQYVNDRGLVDYRTWVRSPQQLHDWLQTVSQVNPKLLDSNQQLALWLNLYNALTIARVLKKYPIDSILPSFLGIPNWLAFWWFFSRPAYTINSDRYSLNNIEHDILRPHFQEPRIHFALVCASMGCPLLRNEAYKSDRVLTQLDEDARRFINNPDKVYYNAKTQTLYCSKIFKWYQKDFLTVANSVPEYIQNYLVDTSFDATTTIEYLDYSWNLNQRISA